MNEKLKAGMFIVGRVVGAWRRTTKNGKEIPEVNVLVERGNGTASIIKLIDFDGKIELSEGYQEIPFYVKRYRDQESGKQYISYVVAGERGGNGNAKSSVGSL